MIKMFSQRRQSETDICRYVGEGQRDRMRDGDRDQWPVSNSVMCTVF